MYKLRQLIASILPTNVNRLKKQGANLRGTFSTIADGLRHTNTHLDKHAKKALAKRDKHQEIANNIRLEKQANERFALKIESIL